MPPHLHKRKGKVQQAITLISHLLVTGTLSDG